MYVEIAEPLVDKLVEELNRFDYKFTKIEHGKQLRLDCLQDAEDALTNVSKINHELWKRKNRLKQEFACLDEVIQQRSSQHAVVTSQTPREKRIVQATDSWFGEVISEAVQAVIDTIKVLERI